MMRFVLSMLLVLMSPATTRAQAPAMEGCIEGWDVDDLIRVEKDKSLLYAESPNGKIDVVLDYTHSRIQVIEGTRLLKRVGIKEIEWSAEVIWAPDSRAFAVQWSDGGYGGIYHVRVFQIEAGGVVVELPSASKAKALFAKAHHCEKELNNTFVRGWVRGSRQLMLGAEVYNSSICGKQMGFYRGYLVDTATGTILKAYPGIQLTNLAPSCPM